MFLKIVNEEELRVRVGLAIHGLRWNRSGSSVSRTIGFAQHTLNVKRYGEILHYVQDDM